ncbi:unnamed protein product, partial [Brassica rapa subsp. trilocularis]
KGLYRGTGPLKLVAGRYWAEKVESRRMVRGNGAPATEKLRLFHLGFKGATGNDREIWCRLKTI